MLNLLVLFGGQSSEHEVSARSAASALPYLDSSQFKVTTVGITCDGHWLYTQAPAPDIESGTWTSHPSTRPCWLSGNQAMKGLHVAAAGGIDTDVPAGTDASATRPSASFEVIPIDCVFPIMHGQMSEDGAIQGYLEICGLPYVGAGIAASACGMDKALTKIIVAPTGIAQAEYAIVWSSDLLDAESASHAAARVLEQLDGSLPLFVKPASAGSSVGITKVADAADLPAALQTAAQFSAKVLIEKAIVGREIELAVLGNTQPRVTRPGEIVAARDFYDYESKYICQQEQTIVPAPVTDDECAALQDAALKIFKALGCRGMARVDFFLTADSQVVFNEINTIPGFTSISMYPKLWEDAGLSYSELLTQLVDLAMQEQ